jgi:DNA-binding transcriptional ArsR family regulator
MGDDKLEDETYSLIFTSLKHPLRRRILRMLSAKQLTFSEIQEQITIDSGHLSYHLENLGDLILHNQNGQYQLSSIGNAAVRLMSGVEEQQPKHKTKKPNRSQTVFKVFSLVLAAVLIIASIHVANYTTVVSAATLKQEKLCPTPFVIGADETFEFHVTLEYWRYSSGGMVGNPIFSRGIYYPIGPQAYTFEVEPKPDTFTANTEGKIWLDFTLNTTSRQPDALVLMPFGFPNDLTVDVHTPNTHLQSADLDWYYTKIDHFISPVAEVDQLGTYRFVIKNNEETEWTGEILPNVEWKITEKPYFVYGTAGVAIAVAYLGLLTYLHTRKQHKTEDQQSY